jgi:hypothetical protein
MRIGMVLAVATMLSSSPALAEDLLLIEPCHSIRLQYNTNIREVHIGNPTLAEATVPVNNQRLLIFTAKPRTITQETVEPGGKLTSTSTTECVGGSTTLIVLDENGKEIFPSTPPITSNEVLVQTLPSLPPPGQVVYVGTVPYRCNPVCRRVPQ